MDRFRYFHLCDHQFKITDSDGSVQNVTITNDGTFVDIIVDRARILDIMEVTVVDYDKSAPPVDFFYENPTREQDYEDGDAADSYYDSGPSFLVDYSQYFTTVNGNPVALPLPPTFYKRYLHNRILWHVKPPKVYTVKAKILFTQEQSKLYAANDCPRCQGNAWFVDVLNENGELEAAVGIVLVAQRVVKDLLTRLGSNLFDMTYGTLLEAQMASRPVSATDQQLFDEIRLIVSEVEDHYLTEQALQISTLAPDETLAHLFCSNAYRSTQHPLHVVVELTIQTQSETKVIRIPI